MPIYEYTCADCHRRVSLLWRSFADAENRQAICPRCGGSNLTRLISRVAVLRSEGDRLDSRAIQLPLANSLKMIRNRWRGLCAKWPMKPAKNWGRNLQK